MAIYADQSREAIKARARAMPKASQEVMDIRRGLTKLQGEQKKAFQLADGAGQDQIAKNAAGTNAEPEQNGMNNAMSYINKLNQAKQSQVFSQLDKSRQGALSNISEERAGVKPRYYDARNQTAAGSQQQARNFAEFMTARGGTRGGANAQSEISRQGALQGNIGGLNRQEQQTYDGLDRRTTDVNNAYQSDKASAVAGLEAQKMEALINQFNSDRQFGLQKDQFGLQQQGQNFNQNLATQQYGSQQEQRGLDNDFRQESFEYTKAMNELDNAFRNQQFNFQKASQVWEQNFKNKSFQQGIKEFGAQMGIQQQNLNQRGQQFLAEMTYKNEAMQLNKDQFAQQKFETDVANEFKRREMDFMEDQGPKLSASEISNKIQSDYVGKIDSMTPENKIKFFQAERPTIISDMGLDGYKKLREEYGIFE